MKYCPTHNPPFSSSRYFFCPALLCVLIAFPGCTKEAQDQLKQNAEQAFNSASEKATTAAKSVKDKTSTALGQAAEAAGSMLPKAGSATLVLTQEVEFSGARVRLIDVGARGRIVQMRSYENPAKETFPSFLFQSTPGSVDAAALGDLVGAVVEGKLFVQIEENGPVWSCPLGGKVQLEFSAITESGEFAGVFASGMLESSAGEQKQVTGSFSAFVEPATPTAGIYDGAQFRKLVLR